jgi:hypothetical protein
VREDIGTGNGRFFGACWFAVTHAGVCLSVSCEMLRPGPAAGKHGASTSLANWRSLLYLGDQIHVLLGPLLARPLLCPATVTGSGACEQRILREAARYGLSCGVVEWRVQVGVTQDYDEWSLVEHWTRACNVFLFQDQS